MSIFCTMSSILKIVDTLDNYPAFGQYQHSINIEGLDNADNLDIDILDINVLDNIDILDNIEILDNIDIFDQYRLLEQYHYLDNIAN